MPGRIYSIVLLFLLFLTPQVSRAEHCVVSQVGILPGPWENTSTKTSLTLQTQDVSGALCHVGQTLRFMLTSLPNGNFTGQTGNALQYFISTNSANRNFYFEGSPASVLTVKAGYGPSESWVEQFILTHSLAGTSTPSVATSTGSDSNRSADSGGAGTSSSVASLSSAHFSSVSLSAKKVETIFSLSAGRDRIGSTGSPLEFKAESNLSYTRNSIFKWNFGDGSEAGGEVVTHVYEYPGEYVVVLSLTSAGGGAVSRTNVRVIDPEIKIVNANSEKIDIKNESLDEVSMYGRVLVAGDDYFIFPKDTIIKPGRTISYGSSVTGLKPLSIQNAHLINIGDTENAKIHAKILDEKRKKILEIQSKISFLESKIAQSNIAAPSIKDPEIKAENTGREENKTQAALAKEAMREINRENHNGWLSTLKNFFLMKK